jgi:oxygen-independent coproporphyrinogen III oxidase
MADFLYIHIPFCLQKCIYCDFFSVIYDGPTAQSYIDALCEEIHLRKAAAGILKTVYIGGGTPSLLPGECFIKLFQFLRDNFRLSQHAEITVEANPGTLNGLKIDTLCSAGVNRLSVGVQSFDDHELRFLGRIHSAGDTCKSLDMIKKAGIKNFSLDLMYGIPGQTMDSWRSSLSRALEFSPSHISTYELTPEKNTPLSALLATTAAELPAEDLVVGMYDTSIEFLAGHGYEHYEISNFALPGYRCMHNLNYWNRGGYIGVGAGAHSFEKGIRSKNNADIKTYIERLGKGVLPESESSEVSSKEVLKEIIFLGLRKTEGIHIRKAEEEGLSLINVSGELVDEGYLKVNGDYLSLTQKGIIISNTIIVKLFEKLGL